MKSGRELLRLLRSHGFEVKSIKGSHYKLVHRDGRMVTLPFCNSQYPKPTYHRILKSAGLE